LSTYSQKEKDSLSDWISQAEAARIRGTTRQAVAKLVKNGRLRTIIVGGYVLVSRTDVMDFKPQPAGRPKTNARK
jgi:excisionase family DNA binding protein